MFREFYHTEKDGTFLVSGDNFAFYCPLGDGWWLEAHYLPENYPSLAVTMLQTTEEEITERINNQLQGWQIIRCHLEGVHDENGYVVEGE